MKLSKDNLDLNLLYSVVKSEHPYILVGDRITVDFEVVKHYGDAKERHEFTLFRWRRIPEDHNETWRFETVDPVLHFLSSIDVEPDMEHAYKRVRALRSEIDILIYNYSLDETFSDLWDHVDIKDPTIGWSYRKLFDKDDKLKVVLKKERFDA